MAQSLLCINLSLHFYKHYERKSRAFGSLLDVPQTDNMLAKGNMFLGCIPSASSTSYKDDLKYSLCFVLLLVDIDQVSSRLDVMHFKLASACHEFFEHSHGSCIP